MSSFSGTVSDPEILVIYRRAQALYLKAEHPIREHWESFRRNLEVYLQALLDQEVITGKLAAEVRYVFTRQLSWAEPNTFWGKIAWRW